MSFGLLRRLKYNNTQNIYIIDLEKPNELSKVFFITCYGYSKGYNSDL